MFERLRSGVAVLLLPAALIACRDSGKDELFELAGRLVVFNYREAKVTYLVNLVPLRPIGESETAVMTLDNPAGGSPLIVTQKLFPNHQKVTLESPPLECVVKDKPYKVSIRIEGGDGALLQSIETEMISSQDQNMLPDKPLVVGPGYQPNPELAGHPNGRLPGGRGVTCPAAS